MESADSSKELSEHFVDADKAAEFLSLERRHVLELARSGHLPAYPLGTGQRYIWRFRLSELSEAMVARRASRLHVKEN
jgi:excisionase family DNA binding protein